MTLTKEQRKQIEKQLRAHQHDTYHIDIPLSESFILKNFAVHKNVLRPEQMVALLLARFLFSHNELYTGEPCLDMGCGSGIQGVIMGLNGATKVVFSDISNEALANTTDNVAAYHFADKATVIHSNLFEKIRDNFDVIVFNHPFFPENPLKATVVSKAMLDSGELLQRFLANAKKHLKKNGKIIMPYYDIAGKTNDPYIQGKRHDYTVATLFSSTADAKLQKGKVHIYALTL